MTDFIKLPGLTNLNVDLTFMSHLSWNRGYRDRSLVSYRFTNFFRKLFGLPLIRDHYVKSTEMFDGWNEPTVKLKINGQWHYFFYGSNYDAETIFNYLKNCKVYSNKIFPEPTVSLKHYYSY
jgi:hypothetical protein